MVRRKHGSSHLDRFLTASNRAQVDALSDAFRVLLIIIDMHHLSGGPPRKEWVLQDAVHHPQVLSATHADVTISLLWTQKLHVTRIVLQLSDA